MAKGTHEVLARSLHGLGNERAKKLALILARHAAQRAADPTTPFRELLKLASPHAIGSSVRSEHHEILRRYFVLRAWGALQIARLSGEKRCFMGTDIPMSIGYWREARVALQAARAHRQIAASARKVER